MGLPKFKDLVILKIPNQALFVGSYHRIPVLIDPRSKIKFEDLIFEIPAGVKGGLISASKDREFNLKKPAIMLLAGHQPGNYELIVKHMKLQKELARAKFRVDALWKNEALGPTRWFSGILRSSLFAAAWGGGGGHSAKPQHLYRHRHQEDRDPAGGHEFPALFFESHRSAELPKPLAG
jgi:hypothetical protein